MNGNLEDATGNLLDVMRRAVERAHAFVPDIRLAAFTDNGDCDENHLLAQLSPNEHEKAMRLSDAQERRHFILRRCFQRVFVSTHTNWRGSLPDLRLIHQTDTRPTCTDAPDLCLSFSSSGNVVLACGSRHHDVGIDVEKTRNIENVGRLAQRFFAPGEAESISALTGAEQNLRFLHHWTAKEAGLKAIGKGIVSGLNSFTLSCNNGIYGIVKNTENPDLALCNLHYPDVLPDHVVALMHRPRKI